MNGYIIIYVGRHFISLLEMPRSLSFSGRANISRRRHAATTGSPAFRARRMRALYGACTNIGHAFQDLSSIHDITFMRLIDVVDMMIASLRATRRRWPCAS